MEKEKKNSGYLHILKYIGVFGSIQVCCMSISLVRNKILAVLLAPGGMGLISIFNSTVNLLVSAVNLGLPASGVKEISTLKAMGDEIQIAQSVKMIRSWTMLAAILGMLVCIACSPLFDKFAFTWGNHVFHFVLLSPVVGMTVFVGGELAVLKALGALKALAMVSLYTTLGALFVSVPIFFFFGQAGIVPVLLLQVVVQLVLVMRKSCRLAPLRLSFRRSFLSNGLGIIKLGLAFVLAGVLNSGTEFLIRFYLNRRAGLDTVGLFNATCSLVWMCSAVVFASLDSDFFPRLSAMASKGFRSMGECVNRQIEVSVLLMGPFVCMMVLVLPVLVPILYDKTFLGMLGMSQWATAALLFRAVYLPIEYIPLSLARSRVYLWQEALCTLLLLAFQLLGFSYGGIMGMGVGMTMAYVIEMCGIVLYSRCCFHFVLASSVWIHLSVHVFFLMQMLLLTLFQMKHGLLYWMWGGGVVLFSAIFSFVHLRHILAGKLSSRISSQP